MITRVFFVTAFALSCSGVRQNGTVHADLAPLTCNGTHRNSSFSLHVVNTPVSTHVRTLWDKVPSIGSLMQIAGPTQAEPPPGDVIRVHEPCGQSVFNMAQCKGEQVKPLFMYCDGLTDINPEHAFETPYSCKSFAEGREVMCCASVSTHCCKASWKMYLVGSGAIVLALTCCFLVCWLARSTALDWD
eukprot:TRINITY_DN8300_c0_g2_i2.p1 TRINITY_DN8300_c0_g2~~TRINITY_DN8300_c0_g2_i2.p1  ORF type:complete len:188 (-),score=7.37 TRINITY_DN8300_c0_g2_i2:133-696(-)